MDLGSHWTYSTAFPPTLHHTSYPRNDRNDTPTNQHRNEVLCYFGLNSDMSSRRLTQLEIAL